MAASAPSSVVDSTPLSGLLAMYDEHRYLDVWNSVSAIWQSSPGIDRYSVEELIFAGRLSLRLGGPRLARHLFRKARALSPEQPKVRYFTDYLGVPGRSILDELAAFEANPDLGGDDPEVRANWLAQYATVWARLRNMPRALDLMRQAHAIHRDDAWLHSMEADLWGLGEDWVQSLRVAEHAWSLDPRSPWTAASLAAALMNNGQIGEAVARLKDAADETQSTDLLRTACWYQCAWSEMQEGSERLDALARARRLAERIEPLAPLADREFRAAVARLWLDIAQLSDDRSEMDRWASAARSPFHREVLANLKKNPQGRRIRLPYRRVLQKHAECVPASVSAALSANGIEISTSEFAAGVTYGGTAEWAAADWLRSQGLHVRLFNATAETTRRLLEHGIGFMVTWPDDDGGHAVAVIGIDEAAGVVLANDPSSFREAEYLFRVFDQNASPYGVLSLAAVGKERAQELDALLPPEAAVTEAVSAQLKALSLLGPSAAQQVLRSIAGKFPEHPAVRYMMAIQNLEEGRSGEALTGFMALLKEFPRAPLVRLNVTVACRAMGNTSLLRGTLRAIVETGRVRGVDAGTEWVRPHPRYVVEYADLLRESSATRREAELLLRSVLRDHWSIASAWHVMADLRWQERRINEALLAYSIASFLAPHSEHYASAYVDLLAHEGRVEEGFTWLESRTERLGRSLQGVNCWMTWIALLERRGYPERAFEVFQRAEEQHAASIALLSFAVSFLARRARWEQAQTRLMRLRQTEGRAAFHEASVAFHRMRGEPRLALEHAEAWVRELPRSMDARFEVLALLRTLEGDAAAAARARQWMHAHPADQDFEEAFCRYAEGDLFWQKIRVLKRRVKRNAEDGWAWRELVFAALARYERADAGQRQRLRPRVEAWLAQAVRVSRGHVSLVRAEALWLENRDQWRAAVDLYLEAVRLAPEEFYAYRRAWDCAARLPELERRAVWAVMEQAYLGIADPLPYAGEMIGLLAGRFGVPETEAIAARWQARRPDDPNVLEAAADLLLDHGRGRTAAARALELLEPAVKRFPDHAGLRFSLARAYRALNRNPDANRVFADLVERRPNDISALINLGWIQHREADTAGGLRTLERAQVQAPRDPRPLDQRAQMLIDAGRRDEAIATVETMMRSIPSSVQTYDWAIGRLSQLNLFERAVEAARAGTRTFPRGAYLWLLLGKMLQQNSDLAAPGEVETCLRQSLRQNATLFESVDWLAILLLEQQREEEAKQLLLEVERHMADPAAARGRLAWIRRQGEEKKQALEDMEAVVRDAPWYSWGWYRLLEWLQEDQRWEQARASLATIPPAMLHDFQFRRKRVELLEKAGALSSTTDPEWDALLSDLPEETPLHLGRFDALGKAGRMREAAELLRRLLPAEQDNVYLRARMVQVDCFEKNFAAAVEDAMVVAFTRNDESEWPVNQVWEQIRAAGHLEEFTRRFMLGLKQGKEPAERALVLYAEHLFAGEYPSFQWIRRSWLHAATRNIRRLVRLVERSSWVEEHHLAKLMEVLNKEGYRRMVVACWRRMKARGLGSETAAWAQTGSALINLQKKGEARALLADWRTRRGIKMWMLANYLIALPRMSQSGCDEVIRTCREALEKLPHDHCARYLVYMGAEACVLIGDREGLMAFCETHRGYVAGTPQPGEFFPAWQRYLVDELLVAVRLVANPGEAGWGRVRWKLRLKRLWTPATRARARQIFILLVRIAAIATLSGGTLLRLFR